MPQDQLILLRTFIIILITLGLAYFLLFKLPKIYPNASKLVLSLIIGFIWGTVTFVNALKISLSGQPNPIEFSDYTFGLPALVSGFIFSNIPGVNLLVLFLGSVISASILVFLLILGISKILPRFKK